MTPISSDHFRLEQNSLLLEAAYHDVIRASPREDGSLQFHEISAKSKLLTYSWILSQAVIDSPEFREFLEFVGGLGGAWERILGGMIFVHVPPEGANAVEEHLNAVVSRFKN